MFTDEDVSRLRTFIYSRKRQRGDFNVTELVLCLLARAKEARKRPGADVEKLAAEFADELRVLCLPRDQREDVEAKLREVFKGGCHE
jgi:NTP pyrophosphatase (non-canonical NTP hydrolase)